MYTSLVAAARASGGTARLVEWRGERDAPATSLYERPGRRPVRPDGFGCWVEDPSGTDGSAASVQVVFFLEYDTGTEHHATLVDKLGAYDRAAGRDPEPWVLFVFTTVGREAAVRAGLAPTRDPYGLAVATAVHTPGVDASGPIWAPLHGSDAEASSRMRLADLALHAQFHELARIRADQTRQDTRGRFSPDHPRPRYAPRR